ASPSAPAHGLPACWLHAPPEQLSAPLQKRPSLHGDVLPSAALQSPAASLHDSWQLPSPSGPGHGFPACTLHAPPEHESSPLQKIPSSQGERAGSKPLHPASLSLHDSEQSESPSAPGHTEPECWLQSPAMHVSLPLHTSPSSQLLPFASLPVHAAAASSQVS